jgi:transcriptional regulator of acetoin/glycerol metabolism
MSGNGGNDWKKRTRPVDDSRDRRPLLRPSLHLVRVLGYDRPDAAGSRHRLDVSEVLIGRGDRNEAARHDKTLTLRIADDRISTRHARIAQAGGTWMIEDLGSTNGMWVDGVKVERAELADSTLVELGGTAFLTRVLIPSGAPDVEASELDFALPGIVTFSTTFHRELANVARLAPTTQSIVINGETGTGKEVLSRAVHAASKRSGPFIAINCGALPPNLVESELFGHKKGAFSGATDDRAGLVREALGGTLLLDEIGDLPLNTQAALLRVLQEREVMPIGASRPVSVDVRVLAATHRSLDAEVKAGRFREDLWARLTGYTTVLPPLRERLEDLGLLVAAFLVRINAQHAQLTAGAGQALLQYDWPRNIRELEQVLRSAVALAGDGPIELGHLPDVLQESSPVRSAKPRREPLSPEQQQQQLEAALRKHDGNISAVGRELGVARVQVHRWITRFKINLDDYRPR